MTHFEPHDYLRHHADASGRMRDSLFWETIIPEEKLGFQAYLYLTASGKAGFNVCIWGGDEKTTVDRIEGQIPDTMNLDAFALDGLTLTQSGIGERDLLTYESDRIKLAFDFTGKHEPFSYRANPDGLPAWMAVNRYEQTGWIKGFVEVRGRRITLDRIGHRDHSWGNRNWGMPQHWKWFVAYTPDGGKMLNGWIWIARGEWGFGGYVVQGGVPVAISHIKHHATFDPDMSQRHLDAEIHDVGGGVTHLTLDSYGIVKLPAQDKLGTIIQEAACTATIDGVAGAGQFETHWQQSYLDHLIETKSTA
jgi:hypothetical protein